MYTFIINFRFVIKMDNTMKLIVLNTNENIIN